MKPRVYNFCAGPAMVPPEVLEALREDLCDWQGLGRSVLEVSHRTEAYRALQAKAIANLHTLLGLGDDYDIITDDILLPIVSYRTNILKSHCTLLTVDDILVALSICSAKNEKAKKALDCLPQLHGCEAHATYILPSNEETTLKKLGINITCDPVFTSNNLFEY